MNRKQKELGLTLIEMLVVLAILSVLVSVAVPYIGDFRDDGMKRRQKEQFERVKQAYRLYERVFSPGLASNTLASYFDPDASTANPQGFLLPMDSGTPGASGQVIVDNEVLNGGAGVSYLSYWTPSEFVSSSGGSPSNVQFLSVWGETMKLELPSGKFGDVEISVDVPGQSVKVDDEIPRAQLLNSEAKLRAEVVGQALQNYWRDYPNAPATSGHPQSFSMTTLKDPALSPLRFYLGQDPRWYSGFIWDSKDWLLVKPDVDSWNH